MPFLISLKTQQYTLIKKLLTLFLCALLLIFFINFYLFPLNLTISSTQNLNVINDQIVINSSFHPQVDKKELVNKSEPVNKKVPGNISTEIERKCDYTEGKWVKDKKGPLYKGTSCNTIKDGQNCMSHGRPDKGYLYWRWMPKECELSRFDPKMFLEIVRNKHVAFVGDSIARNQLESLMCMLATASKPKLLFKEGEENKFRKWKFPSYNATVSIYWSPFLVKGVEKKDDMKYNLIYLDSINERWAKDLSHMNLIVLSVGHWFLNPSLYYQEDKVLGCHVCRGENYTNISFFDILGKVLNKTLQTVIERKSDSMGDFGVFVTTFSPHHFEGEWDKFGACPKTAPYSIGEKNLEGMDADMRSVQIREVKEAKEKFKGLGNSRLEALDVTKVALLRPDGHPGPYMYKNPFANGIGERVHNDCVHWCLPGPIDTWNEILLDVLKRWHSREL
ncbi:hypothetical protein Leryth_019139 [Lithospermum erythrorhizon]|nr:hypothetical protein Leryth_019139 [Lithospermum erythrorhizon]